MSRLFGVPVGTLSFVLAIGVGLALASVTALALRNRIFFKLGLRNMTRRRGRSAIIVAGLMLGTAIVASALGTGDTMASTVRSSVLVSRGNVDEVLSARSADSEATAAFAQFAGKASVARYLTPAEVAGVSGVARGSKLVDGVAPAISEMVAVADTSSRQTQSRVTLFATDPDAMGGFGAIRDTGGRSPWPRWVPVRSTSTRRPPMSCPPAPGTR